MQPFNTKDQIIHTESPGEVFYLCFPALSRWNDLRHRVYARNCGYSSHPYKSLNISNAVGDDPDSVKQNLRLIHDNIKADRLIHMNQQHGKKVISLKAGKETETIFDADALITDIPCSAIMVKQADCQGVILFDPEKRVVAVVHSGWKGSVQDILGETVKIMKTEYNCCTANIMAAIGPSLGPCCAEFTTWKDIFPDYFSKFRKGECNFDFWAISEMQLINAGISRANIERADICTKCRTDMFFSYRGEGITGRFATVAMIKKP